jgi:zinc-binding in reverse transcriptase
MFRGVLDQQYLFWWKLHLLLKIKLFMWLVSKNRILTKENLSKRGWIGAMQCCFCTADESVEHMFV